MRFTLRRHDRRCISLGKSCDDAMRCGRDLGMRKMKHSWDFHI